jgi:LDH2 family malate/lactate/ureidoglycolate dehydrogenase
MKTILLNELDCIMSEILRAYGLSEKNIKTVVNVYLMRTKAGVGHHDIYDFIPRMQMLQSGTVEKNPAINLLHSFGCMENWDGGNGLGEIVCSFGMGRAIELAKQYGIGFCTIRNSNHYLASLPYTLQAAKDGFIGLIIARAYPSMGVPGYKGKIIGQAPNGYAFPTGDGRPVVLDGCMAYVSGHGNLQQMVEQGKSVPEWWGVDSDGQPTTDPAKLLVGTRYPIGEHKGFGYTILFELLTGVFSHGLILDQTEGADGLKNVTSHTAIAIKADALMSMEEYEQRSAELIKRIEARAPGIRIPGHRTHQTMVDYEKRGEMEITDTLYDQLNALADSLNVKRL